MRWPSRCEFLALAALVACWAGTAEAQTRGCTLTTYSDPPREVLACPDGLSIAAENGAGYTLRDRNGDGRPDGLQLTAKGVFVDVPPGRRGGFQVQTPHAIASVRGTSFGVEASAARSSVFVQAGIVAVNRTGESGGVSLRAGEGVDVASGAEPLQVRRWPVERASNFLARFGR